MPVITADGLVGKIMQTGQNWSKVLTILDRNCSVGAVIQRTRDPAVAEGEINLAAKGFAGSHTSTAPSTSTAAIS